MIPRILHQAWVGPKPLPVREKAWCASMKAMNTTWDVRFYGNEVLKTYEMDPYVKALQHLDKPWAFIVDRIRMLLLRDHGGVWLDCDCEPVRPLDSIRWAWESHLTFIYSGRSPDRAGVALHRGISLVDNTFLASTPNSRMCQRILSLWRPQNVIVDGHAVGTELLRNQNLGSFDTGALPFHYFYGMQRTPETIVLHDATNLSSWVEETKRSQARMIA